MLISVVNSLKVIQSVSLNALIRNLSSKWMRGFDPDLSVMYKAEIRSISDVGVDDFSYTMLQILYIAKRLKILRKMKEKSNEHLRGHSGDSDRALIHGSDHLGSKKARFGHRSQKFWSCLRGCDRDRGL